MEVLITGWIVREEYPWSSGPEFSFVSRSLEAEKPKDNEHTLYLKQHTFTVEVPEGPMILERVTGIREAKRAARLALKETLHELDEQEQKLLCLTNEVVK